MNVGEPSREPVTGETAADNADHDLDHLLDGEAHDRRLARAALSMRPAQRLRNLSNMWPLARAHQTVRARRVRRAEDLDQ